MWTTILGLLNKAKPLLNNKYVLSTLIAAVALVGGYFIGRYSTPAKVVEKEKIVEKVVYQEKVVEKIVYVEKKNQKKRKETTTVERPDGTKETKTVENEETNTDTNINKDTTKEVIVYKDKIVEKEKLVLRGPDWRVSAGVGLSIPYHLGQPELGVPGMKSAVVQVELARRLAGPAWLNVWANTQGTLGIGVDFTF